MCELIINEYDLSLMCFNGTLRNAQKLQTMKLGCTQNHLYLKLYISNINHNHTKSIQDSSLYHVTIAATHYFTDVIIIDE